MRYPYKIQDHPRRLRLGVLVVSAVVYFEDSNNNGEIAESEVLQCELYYPVTKSWGRGPSCELPLDNRWTKPAPALTPTQDFLYPDSYRDKEYETTEDLNWFFYGARWYDPAVGRFTGVDDLAEKFLSQGAYNYVANNPLVYIDPDGNDIVNGYEQFKAYGAVRNRLLAELDNASSRGERKSIKRTLRKNRKNFEGYGKYLAVKNQLNKFMALNSEEYEYVDNLSFKGQEIDVIVGVSLEFEGKGEVGQNGDTNYGYNLGISKSKDGSRGTYPASISNNKIYITLYKDGLNTPTLANEFGDAIFGVEAADKSYEESKSKVPYHDKAATNFSFDYSKYITKGGERPDPKTY